MFVQKSSKPSQANAFVEESIEAPAWTNRTQPVTERVGPKRIVARVRDRDWTVGLLYAFCDVVCWVLLYAFVGYVRRDAFFVSEFEFVLVDCITLIVIVQALYIVGGYNRNTETRGLTYTAEHILAITVAAVISSLPLYTSSWHRFRPRADPPRRLPE